MLEGYKTYIGGFCFILVGIGSAGKSWYLGEPIDFETVFASIGAGISIIGGRSAFKQRLSK